MGVCRRTVKTLRVELKQQQAVLHEIQAARDEAQASVRVVSEERQQMKAEWADMFASHDGLKNRIAELSEQLTASEHGLAVRILHGFSVPMKQYVCQWKFCFFGSWPVRHMAAKSMSYEI